MLRPKCGQECVCQPKLWYVCWLCICVRACRYSHNAVRECTVFTVPIVSHCCSGAGTAMWLTFCLALLYIPTSGTETHGSKMSDIIKPSNPDQIYIQTVYHTSNTKLQAEHGVQAGRFSDKVLWEQLICHNAQYWSQHVSWDEGYILRFQALCWTMTVHAHRDHIQRWATQAFMREKTLIWGTEHKLQASRWEDCWDCKVSDYVCFEMFRSRLNGHVNATQTNPETDGQGQAPLFNKSLQLLWTIQVTLGI